MYTNAAAVVPSAPPPANAKDTRPPPPGLNQSAFFDDKRNRKVYPSSAPRLSAARYRDNKISSELIGIAAVMRYYNTLCDFFALILRKEIFI
jgi:hypothetical protein